MKQLPIGFVLLATSLARADFTPTQHLLVFADETGICQECLSGGSGSYSFNFNVQQFDQSLGTLMFVHATYSNGIDVGYCFNDELAPPGNAFQVTTTRESVNADLGIDASASLTEDHVTTGTSRCFTTSSAGHSATLTGSGTVYSSEFIGQGTVPIVFTDTVGMFQSPLGGGVVVLLTGTDSNVAYLNVAYEYQPVPEPHHIWILILGFGLCLSFVSYAPGACYVRESVAKPSDPLHRYLHSCDPPTQI